MRWLVLSFVSCTTTRRDEIPKEWRDEFERRGGLLIEQPDCGAMLMPSRDGCEVSSGTCRKPGNERFVVLTCSDSWFTIRGAAVSNVCGVTYDATCAPATLRNAPTEVLTTATPVRSHTAGTCRTELFSGAKGCRLTTHGDDESAFDELFACGANVNMCGQKERCECIAERSVTRHGPRPAGSEGPDPFEANRLVANTASTVANNEACSAALYSGPSVCFVREWTSYQARGVHIEMERDAVTAEAWLECGNTSVSCGHELRCICATTD